MPVTFDVSNKLRVDFHYGPYEAHGIIAHKTQRLYGVKTRLEELGYLVEITPTQLFNTLIVKMKNRQIFRCDIRNLMFNMDYEDDIVAKRLIEAVEEANHRFSDDSVWSTPLHQEVSLIITNKDVTFSAANLASCSMKNLAPQMSYHN